MAFSWVPFYHEVVQEVLKYEDRQDELLALLAEMKAADLPTIPLEDNQADGPRKPLTGIDPFTFLANFSRTGDAQATRLCEWLKTRWILTTPTPTDFDGRASVEAQNSWFFASTRSGRKPDDVPLLWQLAQQATGEDLSGLDPDLFVRCLKINNVAIKKLTTGLFWFSPGVFLPLVGPVMPFLTSRNVDFDPKKLVRGDLNEYRALIKKAHSINVDNAALSHEAWTWALNKSLLSPVAESQRPPLNQILYGPPGTGKTFNSINRAVEIIDGIAPGNRDECKDRFDELRDSGQVEFVTFHQSFSYEEFIEGLRPILVNDGSGQARYEIRDGILKEMALRATKAIQVPATASRPSFDELWGMFVQRMEDSSNVIPAVGKGPGLYEIHLSEDNAVKATNIAGRSARDYRVPLKTIEKIWHGLRAAEKPTSDVIRIIYGDGTPKGFDCNLGGAVLQALQEIEKEVLVAGGAQPIFDRAPRYVLIVDEINRGNISKILGELITLLEEDKRLGADNELRVKLPVSGASFCLPPNLYILGTMNTADKSLALLDIALRRRFSFVEMAPDAKHFPEFACKVLETLNLRLEAALDREHRLGHAYFIGCKDEEAFNRVFRDKVIPLLQEFFYNDWETLRGVLGESGSGSDTKGFIRTLPALNGLKARTKWRWWFDVEGDGEFNPFAVLATNYKRLESSGQSENE